VNHRWLGGTLTNWRTVSGSIARLRELETVLETETGRTKKQPKQAKGKQRSGNPMKRKQQEQEEAERRAAAAQGGGALGLPQQFFEHGSRGQVLADAGLTEQDVARRIAEWSAALADQVVVDLWPIDDRVECADVTRCRRLERRSFDEETWGAACRRPRPPRPASLLT